MPRSSFSDNPLLRVSRPVSACSRCRAAKVKCDGKLPACTACEKAGRENECSSANDQFARGKERSYVAALELRIEKLERRLAFARSRKASVNLYDVDEPPQQYDRKDSLAKIRAAIHRKAARKREDAHMNSLISDFGSLSVDATSRDFEPSVNNMSFGLFVLAASANDDLPETTTSRLFPPRHEIQPIVHYYMTQIWALYPCFPETKLLTVLDDMYHHDDRVIQDSDYWLAYMVLAIGYIAQSQNRSDQFYQKAVDFAARALSYADGALTPGYVAQIQSLILFTQYSMLDPTHFDSWHLIGFACRAVMDMGFHHEPPRNQVGDATALDLRRALFYCVYSLDRAISMAHARAFGFTDDSINVDYPSSSVGRLTSARRNSIPKGTITGPQDTQPAKLFFEFRRKQSYWYQILFQSEPTPLPDASAFIWQMCLDMREWSESLPNTLPVPIRELFDLELRYSYVYCLAPSARGPHLTPYTRALIFEHAIAYVNSIHTIARRSNYDNAAFHTYHDVLKLYFIATQLVTVLKDGFDALLSGALPQIPITRPGAAPPPPLPPRQLPAESNLSRSLRCLRQVVEAFQRFGERWDNALPLKESFEVISSELWGWLRVRERVIEHPQPPPPPLPHQPPQQPTQHYQMQPLTPNPGANARMSPQAQGPMSQVPPPGVPKYHWTG